MEIFSNNMHYKLIFPNRRLHKIEDLQSQIDHVFELCLESKWVFGCSDVELQQIQ